MLLDTDVSLSEQIAPHRINGHWRDSAEHGISHDPDTGAMATNGAVLDVCSGWRNLMDFSSRFELIY
jgi:hypothetical protein